MTTDYGKQTAGAAATKPVRVMLIDDHRVIRAGLRLLVEEQPGLMIVGEAGGRADALAVAAREQPDVIILDLDLAGTSGLDLLPELHAAAGSARVLILTGILDAEAHARAMREGAMGLVLKEKAPEVLIKAIEKVHRGEVWFDRSLLGSLQAERARPHTARETDREAAKVAALTEREREVIALVGEGLRNKQIGDRLFISEGTVRRHLNTIFGKLEVSDRYELMFYAYRHGLAKPPA